MEVDIVTLINKIEKKACQTGYDNEGILEPNYKEKKLFLRF
jgi:hypothetical protein